MRDTDCVGFSISGSTINDGVTVAISGEYTKLLGIIFGAGANTPNQRRTAAINALKTDGVISVVGTVA
jgi:hexokinase